MILPVLVLSAPRAKEIVAKTRAAYAALQTYEDTGVEDTPGVSNGRHEFRTAFVRPNRLRFTFYDHDSEYVFGKDQRWEVWPCENGHALWTTWSKGLVERGSLREALEKPMASRIVNLAIKLLVTGVHYGPPALDGFRDAEVRAPELIEGVPCVVLSTKSLDAALDLWIDAKTHLIRRFRWRTDYSRARKIEGQQDWEDEVTTVDLHPRANTRIESRVMQFVPPKGAIWGTGAPDVSNPDLPN